MLIGSFADAIFGAAKAKKEIAWAKAKKKIAWAKARKKIARAKAKKRAVKTKVASSIPAALKAVKSATATTTTASRSQSMQLQANLVTLGKIRNDKTLAAIKVDGALGPKTASAIQRALGKKLSVAQIKASVDFLVAATAAEITRRGGQPVSASTVVAAQAAKKAAPKIAAAKTAAAKKKQALNKIKVAKVKVAMLRKKAAKTRSGIAAFRQLAAGKSPAVRAHYLKKAAELEAQLALDEQAIAAARNNVTTATITATQAATVEQTAAQEAVGTIVEHTASAVGPAAATAAAVAAEAPTAVTATEPAPAAEMPTSAIAPATESMFSRYKYPILGAGAAVLLGTILFMRKSAPQRA